MTVLAHDLIGNLSDQEAFDYYRRIHFDWNRWARPKQILPPGKWDVLGLVAGRAGGKTRTGASAVVQWAKNNPRIALIGRTIRDARETMVLGESGIIACCPRWYPGPAVFRPTRGMVEFLGSGAQAFLYTAEEPDQVRGPQFFKAWGDEFAAWKRVTDEKGGDAWSNLQDALRLGEMPQTILTTTPRPTRLVLDTFLGPKNSNGKRLVSREQIAAGEWEFVVTTEDHLGRKVQHRTIVRRWATEENAANQAPGYAAKRRSKYAGSRLGAQELDAEILLANENALWIQDDIDLYRMEAPDSARERLVVAVDPTRSLLRPRDECGIVVVMRGVNSHAYVLEDATIKGSPYDWGVKVLATADKYNADAIVIENIDAEVKNVLRAIAGAARFKWEEKIARGDKKTRAEPVSALYRAGRVHHVNPRGKDGEFETFELLEDEMITWDPREEKLSPNRLDALVWGCTDLLLGNGESTALVVAPGSMTRGED